MDINQAYEMRSTVARWFEAELMAGLFKIRIIESPALPYNVDYETSLLSREIPNINLANLRVVYQRFIPRLFVEDLQGTGYNSPLHRKGVSTTLFNALLVLLAREYSTATPVKGWLSNVDDPTEPAELVRLYREKRERFWRGFGFEIKPDEIPGRKIICADLGDLRQRTNGLLYGQAPVCIAEKQLIEVEPRQIGREW